MFMRPNNELWWQLKRFGSQFQVAKASKRLPIGSKGRFRPSSRLNYFAVSARLSARLVEAHRHSAISFGRTLSLQPQTNAQRSITSLLLLADGSTRRYYHTTKLERNNSNLGLLLSTHQQSIMSMDAPSSVDGAVWEKQTPPSLPPGYDKHHIVFLEAVHLPVAKLPFPHTIDTYQRTDPDQIAERIKGATIVISNIANVKPSDMDQAPHLQLIAIMATGMGWLDKDYCAKRGISVVNAPAANIDAVSEHFLALYFASRKRIGVVDELVHSSDEWVKNNTLSPRVWPQGPPLGCKQETLGIIGYGSLGKRVELLCKALGFKEVLIADRKGAGQTREGRVGFEDVIKRSTTICISCPHSLETINLIDEKELRSMRPEALLINIARGGIVNEAALAKALKEEWIFGAATDVLEKEPGGPGTTPLLPDFEKDEEEVPNLIVTSHVAWFSGITIQKLQGINRDGMAAFVEGRMYDPKVKHCVVVHDGKIWKEL